MKEEEYIALIEDFENAVDRYAWIGSQHPDDQEDIASNYHTVKATILAAYGEIKYSL